MTPISVTVETEIYGSGQKLTAVLIEYPAEISETEVSADNYCVEGLRVASAQPSNGMRSEVCRSGRFVQLTLDAADPANTTLSRTGHGRESRLVVNRPRAVVSQLQPMRALNGQVIEPFLHMESTASNNGIVDRFAMQTFHTKDGKRLDYQLHVMDQCPPGHKYPLVLFMHDAGSCSDDPIAPLVQGSGAVIWARDSAFGRRPCFVLAPHYPEVCANDAFEVTWQADATVQLIRELMARYPIDSARIYGTGQSMGCMMLCEMMLRNPGFFAASLLVAGQWDPRRMVAARNENIWAVVAQGDQKAYPILGEAMRNMAQAGGRLSMGQLDARADASLLDAHIRLQKNRGCNLNFSWFSGNSILPPGAPDHPGMHHVCTWQKAYDIKALREWLFEQRAQRGNLQ